MTGEVVVIVVLVCFAGLFCAIQCIQLCMMNCIMCSCSRAVRCVATSIYSILCCRCWGVYEKVDTVDDLEGFENQSAVEET